MHAYYEPNEYEQQMIAAGIINQADVDLDFQEYLQKTKNNEFQMEYESWLNQKRYFDALNEQYEKEIEPFQQHKLTPEQDQLQERLLREMSYAEQALGY